MKTKAFLLSCCLALAALLPLQVFAAAPTIVGTPVLVGNSTAGNTTSGGSGSYTITASGDDVLIEVTAVYYSGTFSLSSITSSSGSITTDKAFAASLAPGGVYMGTGLYRVHNASAASYTITLSWSQGINGWAMSLAQGHGITGVDGTIPTQVVGNSTSVSTGSVTTTAANDLIIVVSANATGGSGDAYTWTAPFAEFAHALFPTTGMGISVADYAQSSAGAVSAAASLASSGTWVSQIAAYSGSNPAVCTHAGITQAGAVQIPDGHSGSYLSPSGTYVTPDCSTVQYWQPPANVCGGLYGRGDIIVPSTAPGGVADIPLTCSPTTPSTEGAGGLN